MAQTKPKAGQFYGVSNNGTDGEFLQTDGTGGMAWASPITNPTITSIDYPGTQTAADPAGGESVIINGTLFASGITCTVGGTSAVTAFNSATQITITTPAKAAGPYTVAVLNPDGGTASQANFIQYSGVPVWSTAAGTLGNVIENGAASFQVTATEGSDTIEYAVTTGTLPTGLSLATATGAITGTAPTVSADTTTTFSITATDDENQTSASRSFSITVQNDAPSNHFNTIIWTGTNSSQGRDFTNVGFEPGLVWSKLSNSASAHQLYDSVRDNEKALATNSSNAEYGPDAAGYIDGYLSNGFSTVGGSAGNLYFNEPGKNYVAWNFKAGGAATDVTSSSSAVSSALLSANTTLGFSIMKYVQTGNSVVVPHGLTTTPSMIIVKKTSASSGWFVFNNFISGAGRGFLNNSNNFDNAGLPTFTSTNIEFQDQDPFSPGESVVMYSFASTAGFSKVGSYTGSGTATNLITTGFEPAFIMFKNTTAGNSWVILDNKRSPANTRDEALFPNAADAEYDFVNSGVNFLANGFSLTNGTGETNASGSTYIYLAIAADGSTATPSLANSFATEIWTGDSISGRAITVGFQPDMSWYKSRNNAYDHNLSDSLRGAKKQIRPNRNIAEVSATNQITAFTSTGLTLGNAGDANSSNKTYVAWNFKAGGTPSINTDGTITSLVSANQAAGFSIVQYTANGSATVPPPLIGSGLSTEVEMFIHKNIDAAGTWFVYHKDVGVNNYMKLNEYAAKSAFTNFYNVDTNGNFGIRQSSAGSNGQSCIAYCFTSISGYSKVGSYTSNNTSLTINVGFTPGFVLIKNIDTSGGSWNLFDSKRANGSSLWANDSRVDADYSSLFQLNSTGFVVNGQNTNTNNLTNEFLYLAIKEN